MAVIRCPNCRNSFNSDFEKCPYCGNADHVLKRKLNSKKGEVKDLLILTTCPSIEGYRIVEQCGLVFSEIVFKTGIFKAMGNAINNIVDLFSLDDTELSSQGELLEDARNVAIEKLQLNALKKNANAVIGIDAESSIGGDIIHVTMYGTAVRVEKISE